MRPRTNSEIESLKLIVEIVENKLFNEMITNMKRAIADAMLMTEKEEDRDRLYSEAKALERLVGELTSMANQYRMMENV
jgi:hydroxyethylthiazole kinase-like sugar kinase family protein